MASFDVVLGSLKTAKTLAQFVDKGGFATLLGDIELNAAKSCLDNIAISNNPSGQIWNAIGHLESAYQAYAKLIKSYHYSQAFLSVGKAWNVEVAEAKIRLVCCLIALCYWYLNEDKLCKKFLDEAANPLKASEPGTVAEQVVVGAVLLTTGYHVLNWSFRYMFAGKNHPDRFYIYDFQLAQFRDFLLKRRVTDSK